MKCSKLAISLMWKFMERCFVQIINLITQIILARIIAPEQFGQLAIVLVLYNLADLLVQKGFGSSLIRKEGVSYLDINSSFWVSTGISFCGVLVINILAPWFANCYNDPTLILPLRLLSLNLFTSPLYCILNAMYVRNMRFKRMFICAFIATVVAGAFGIILAAHGFGIFALVTQMLIHQYVITFLLLFSSGVKLGFKVSKSSLKEVFSFGKNILISEFLLTLVESMRTLVIGKKYTQEDISYYDRGQIYPATIMRSVNDTAFSVLVPYYSRLQCNILMLKNKYLFTTRILLICIYPVFFGLAAVSKEVVLWLLTEKWLPCVPYLIIFCIYQAIFPYQITAKSVLYALGVSKNVLQIEIVKSVVSIILLVVSIQFGSVYIAVSLIIVRIIGIFLYLHKIKKYMGNISALNCTLKSLLASVVMFVIIYIVDFNIQSVVCELLINVVLGIAIYVVLIIAMEWKFLKLLKK